MKNSERLVAAKAVITDEDRWTQGFLARDRLKNKVAPESPCAIQWCAVGALLHASRNVEFIYPPARRLLESAAREVSDHFSIVDLNDEGSHEDVMRAYDVAIKMAVREENA